MRTRSSVQEIHAAGGPPRHRKRLRTYMIALLSALAITAFVGASGTYANAAPVSAAQRTSIGQSATRTAPQATIKQFWGAYQDPFDCAIRGQGLIGSYTGVGRIVGYTCTFTGEPGPTGGPWVLYIYVQPSVCGGAAPAGTKPISDTVSATC